MLMDRVIPEVEPIDVSVITVSFNCREDLAECVESLMLHTGGLNVQVIVVDNASSDGTVPMLIADHPDVTVIANEANLGFSAANNRGIEVAGGRYLFLLNPDAVLVGDALVRLVEFMDTRPYAAAAVPTLLNRDGSLQYSLRNFPRLGSLLFEALYLHRLFPALSPRFGEMVFDARAYESVHAIDWASGAAMFVRRETIDIAGEMDDSFFLFAEEIDWFKTMREHGLSAYFVPEAQVVHRDDKGGANPALIGQSMYGRSQYWKKHEGPVRAWFARWLLAFYLSLRVCGWALRSLRPDERARRQLAAFTNGLRDVVTDSSSLVRGGTA